MGLSLPRLIELGRRSAGTATLVLVFAAIALLFTFTGFLTGAYRRERSERAQEQFAEGERLAAEHRYAQAIEHYESALTLARDDQRYELALAMALIETGRQKEAETYLLDTLQNDPTNGPANLALTRIYAARNQVEPAILYYHRAIFGLWPERPQKRRQEARLELADFLAARKQYKQALAELLPLESEAGDDLQLMMQTAQRYLAYGLPEQGATLFRQVLQKERDTAEAWEGLGEAKFSLGDYRAAQSAYRQAMRYQSTAKEATTRLALVDQVLSLDPTARRLSTREQYRRARLLLERAKTEVVSCTEDLSTVPERVQADLAAASQAIDQPVRRPASEDVDKVLDLVERLWDARAKLCAAAPAKDKALALIVQRLSR